MTRTSALAALGVALVVALATVAVRGDGPPTKPGDRKANDEDVRRLEKQIDALRAEIDAQEKQFALLGKGNGQAAQVAALTARYPEIEKIITQFDLDTMKLQVEARVLKKLLAEKGDAAPDAQAIQEVLDRDPEVVRLKHAVQKAKALWQQVAETGGNPNATVVREKRAAFDRAEAALKAREDELRKAATAIARDRATAVARARLEQVELDSRVKKEVSEEYKTERDALKKIISASETGAANLDQMKAALVPQRELLAQLQATLLRVRLEAKGVPLPPVPVPAGRDDKLDRILRELAALRKDVQELKAQRK